MKKRVQICLLCVILIGWNIPFLYSFIQSILPYPDILSNNDSIISKSKQGVVSQIDRTISLRGLQAEQQEVLGLYALSACLTDAATGRMLYGKNANNRMPMASTTKILTCLIALENGNPDDVVTVSKYAASMPDVQLGMQEGDKFFLRDLLYSLMLESHNDSAVAIAEHIGGSVDGFAYLMNQRAKELGCTSSYFITPNGLDATELDEYGVNRTHETTAYELSVIMADCIKNQLFLDITGTISKSIQTTDGNRDYTLTNKNALLQRMDGAFSGKTGFTCNAGYCYVGAVERDNKTFIVSLLACGWPNNKNYKWHDMEVLISHAFQTYDTYNFNELISEFSINLSPVPVVNGCPNQNMHSVVTVSLDDSFSDEQKILMCDSDVISVFADVNQFLTAPVIKGDTIGKLYYFLNDTLIKQTVLTAAETVAPLDFKWYIRNIVSIY